MTSAEDRVPAGSIAGAAIAAFLAPLIRPLFHAPTGGVSWDTIHHYPKDFDTAVVALIVAGSFAGALVASRGPAAPEPRPKTRPRWTGVAVAVFLLACLVHDVPYAPLDFYHEGEHLTPASLLRAGGVPYRDVYFDHGLFSDGGLDLLVMGHPPSIVRVRRAVTILGAATLALIAPIAAELCATSFGVGVATFASLCAAGFGVVQLFSYYRLAPIFIAALGLLRYVRTKRVLPLAMAMFASALGVLWSLDTGMFALIGTAVVLLVVRIPRKAVPLAAGALVLPIVVLLAAGADLHRFFVDSFVMIPRVAWIVWSLPQPSPPHLDDFWFWLADDPGRYYVPLVVYGLAAAIAVRRWRQGARDDALRILIVTTFALLLFRSAAGRVDPNHTRFATPLAGVLAVALILEPLAARGRLVGTIVASLFFIIVLDVVPNVTGAAGSFRSWPARHRPAELVPVADLDALRRYVDSFGPDAQILDVSNSEALYFLLGRKSPARNLEIMMWSAPEVFADEMPRLTAHPPACVILEGCAETAFDGIDFRTRVPRLAAWIDAHYPRRVRIGRFLVASR